jgi:hypothetical protein
MHVILQWEKGHAPFLERQMESQCKKGSSVINNLCGPIRQHSWVGAAIMKGQQVIASINQYLVGVYEVSV